jgi:hypothetical protein
MGCLGKGCLILCVFLLFLVIAGAIGFHFGMKRHSAVLHSAVWAKKAHLVAAEPAEIPQFETTSDNIAATKQKWSNFRNNVLASTPTPSSSPVDGTAPAESPTPGNQSSQIELTADDLNNLIAANRRIRGKAFVTIDGNTLQVQTSVPFGEYIGHAGYYLNGDVVVQSNGARTLDNSPLNGITVNGQPIPAEALDWTYRGRSLRGYLSDFVGKNDLGPIEIRDGKVIVRRPE